MSNHIGPPAEELFFDEGLMIRGVRLDRVETSDRFAKIVFQPDEFPIPTWAISPWDPRMSTFLRNLDRDSAGFHLDHWDEKRDYCDES